MNFFFLAFFFIFNLDFFMNFNTTKVLGQLLPEFFTDPVVLIMV